MEQAPVVAEIVATALTSIARCMLCDAPAFYRAVCTPKPRRLLSIGAPAGAVRHAGYGLCEACRRRPDVFDQVESIVLAQPWSLATPTDN
jgi:hypothetical protein